MNPKKVFEEAVKHHLDGEYKKAKAGYQRLMRVYPNNSELLGNLAAVVKREGRFAAAEELLERSLRANPNNLAAIATLSNIRISERNYEEAGRLAQVALSINPDHVESLVNWGIVQIHRNQMQDGTATFHRALHLDPKSIPAKINLANAYRLQKIFVDEVTVTLERLHEQQPDNAEVLFYLAQAYQDKMRFVRSVDCLWKAWELQKKNDYIIAYANALVVLGEFEEALSIYERVLRLDEMNAEIGTTFLFSLNYDDRKTPEQVFDEYRAFGTRFSKQFPRKFDHSNHPKIEGRRIRVAYSSADLYAHVVAYFIAPIFTAHNRAQFELFAYSNTHRPDAVTERMKNSFDHWVDVTNMTHEQVAERIYADKIDVLIDLAGHTSDSRLGAFAMRPAPVQCTYLGYGYTTGMNEIDYFIGDENLTPEGSEPYFSEKIYRVPSPLYAYQPPMHVIPEVAPLPAQKYGYVTFGSMSRIVRFNDRLLSVWKVILDRVPNSRLRLDQKPFEDEETVDRFMGRLEKLGFDRSRVDLVSTRPHWNGYHEMDISLDCWPHNAGTTTFESLFLGVPVVSKRDRVSVGRLSQMVLEPLGLGDWIVDTEEDFIERAVLAASDLDALAELRSTLRPRIQNSPFMDFVERTRGLERAYRDMMVRFEESNR
ncbi:tetratricopeptide repeat protein [Rhabdaerophilum sp. SD176]|uniref:O-linked N-acetylglucosamine transferase, SPINDLY family protein n=1 Tax=Rhabdaerophilum sp. SD176 TaxID=2983548 RepID=UPI0024E00A79|nr:tetratricopeptide repeat protein [Rhabdaerophilum sp. SD176]